MKTVLLLAALFVLSACAAAGAQGSYGLDRGPASYDALKAATEKCAADGGKIVLRDGYDQRELSNYSCKIGGAK
jgi:hypothetical protein